MFTRISCIHVAVNSVAEAAKEYEANFGIKAYKTDTLPELGINNAMLRVGDTAIELIEPLVPGEGPVGKFLAKRGQGVYMTAMEVENLESAVQELREKGVPLINDTPEAHEKGIPVFIHPKASSGLMIELLEKPPG